PTRIEKPARRPEVDPHDVEANLRDLGEVPLHRLRRQALLPRFVDIQGTVADSANPELLVADEEELPSDRGTSRADDPLDSGFLRRLDHAHALTRSSGI